MAKVFTIRRKVFTLLGAQFQIFNDQNALIGFSQQKAFKLKEDIRVFTDEKKTTEMLSIKARSIIDFSAAYDVFDSRTNQKVGALKRKGWSSMLRDSWLVLGPNDEEVGAIQEDSMAMALLRRFLSNLIPQHFSLKQGETLLADFKTHFNPFVHKLTVTVHDNCTLSTSLVLAAGILLVAIEGRQK